MAITVSQLRDLLGQTPEGGTFTMTGDALGITGVQQLFETYLPDQTLTITSAVVNVTALTVGGSFAIASYTGLATIVTFPVDSTGTVVAGIQIPATMPGWTIETTFLNFSGEYLQAFGFDALNLVLSAVPSNGSPAAPAAGIGANFPFTGAEGKETISVSATLPADPTADYLLSAALKPGLSFADLNALAQFAAGVDFNFIPSSVPVLSTLTLTAIRVVVDPVATTIVTASIDVHLSDAWTVVPKLFEFTSIDVTFTVTYPTAAASVSGILVCAMEFGGAELATSFYVPELQMFAELLEPISLKPLLETYLPAPSGSIVATFEVAGVDLVLAAVYNGGTGGWNFSGQTLTGQTIAIGELIAYVASSFGVTDLPPFITGITLENLNVSFDTATKDFTFGVTGKIPVGANTLSIQVGIALLSQANGSFKKSLNGTIVIGSATFTLDFTAADTGTSFTASWTEGSGQTLGFSDITTALGLSAPPIPPDLDLGLNAASFTYDSQSSTFVLAASSVNYGKATLAAWKSGGTWEVFFGLDTGATVNLANLPLIDKVLSGLDTVALEDIGVQASGPNAITQAEATTINGLIDASYPRIPDAGMGTGFPRPGVVPEDRHSLPGRRDVGAHERLTDRGRADAHGTRTRRRVAADDVQPIVHDRRNRGHIQSG